jgi:hypothetical protein
LFPGVYVDSACAGSPNPENEAAAFGVWLQTPDNPSDAFKQARRAQLDADISRATSETIAFYINTTLFNAVGQQAVPKTVNGSTHLQTPRLEFQTPDTIVTIIDGVDEDPTPDVSFTLTIDEKFLGGPRLSPPWYLTTSSLDKDSTWVDLLAFVLTIPLAFTPLFAPISAAAWIQAGEVADAGPPSSLQGIGSGVASQLMPPNIPIPGGLKIPIEYSLRENHNVQNGVGVEVDGDGMYVGGFLLPPVPREPSVALTGATAVTLHIGGGDVDDTVRAFTTDLRGNLTFAWTVNGRPFHSQDSSITLSFNPSVGPFGVQHVAVTVTDADGLTASATMQVTASKQQSHGVGGSGIPQHPA